MPRIRSFDDPRVSLFHQPLEPDPPPPSPDDPLDARRLYLRLEAIGRVLDDLPRQAKRLARWQARRDAALSRVDDVAGVPDSDARRGADAQRKVRFQRCLADAARPSARMAPPARSRGLWSSQRASRPCRLGAGAPRHVLRGVPLRGFAVRINAPSPRACPEDLLPLR